MGIGGFEFIQPNYKGIAFSPKQCIEELPRSLIVFTSFYRGHTVLMEVGAIGSVSDVGFSLLTFVFVT